MLKKKLMNITSTLPVDLKCVFFFCSRELAHSDVVFTFKRVLWLLFYKEVDHIFHGVHRHTMHGVYDAFRLCRKRCEL